MESTVLGSLLVTLLISIFLINIIWIYFYKRQNLPPGPIPLPIIGNLLLIKRGNLVETLMELSSQYGSVYTLYFGFRPAIIICGYQAVKEALIYNAEEFGARGNMPLLDKVFNGYGIIFSNGERWKILRRFGLSTLKKFGFGNKGIEEKIQEEMCYLMKELRSYKEREVDPTHILNQSVANVMSSMVFGKRSNYEDKKLWKLLYLFNEGYQVMSSPWAKAQDLFPLLMNHLPGPHHKITKITSMIIEYIAEKVKQNQETIDPSSPRDYIDCFINKIEEEKHKPDSEFNTNNMLISCLDMFFAGTETISTTLNYGLLILLKYPEIQAKLHKEINQVIGQNRLPNMEDRIKMPYMNAVIHEIQRFCNVTPMGLTHSVTRNIKFRGFAIPKGIDVIPLLGSVLSDPEQYSTPDKFNPDHFLDNNGCFRKSDAFMAFSAGKRKCLGEGLARMELFLFLTTILQNFRLNSSTQFTESDIAPRMNGLANIPINYKLAFIPS